MTRYEQGFITKCAEYGIDPDSILSLRKQADDRSGRTTISEYEKGFLTKCAEMNVDDAFARGMLKYAQNIFGRIGGWIDKGLDSTVGAAARWAGRNYDSHIKPALGAAAGTAAGAVVGGPIGAYAGWTIGRRMSSNPGMQPVQPGAKAITRNGKILTRDELPQPKLTPIQQQAQDYQNGVNKQIADQQTANKARADEQARLDAEWRAKHPASGMSQQNPALQPLPATDQAQAGLQLQHGRFWNSVPSSPYRTLSTGRKPVDPTRDGFTQGMRYPRVSRYRIATPREGVGGDPTVNMDF